jgi:hypothetical protein
MGGRGGSAIQIVADHLGSRKIAEHAVELNQRQFLPEYVHYVGAVRRGDGVGKEHPGDTVVAESAERLHLLVEILVGLADKDTVARLIQNGLGSAYYVGKEFPVDTGDDYPDYVGAALAQIGSDDIALITHLFSLLKHGTTGFLLYSRTARKGPRHGGGSYAERLGYLSDGYHFRCKDTNVCTNLQKYFAFLFIIVIFAPCKIG